LRLGKYGGGWAAVWEQQQDKAFQSLVILRGALRRLNELAISDRSVSGGLLCFGSHHRGSLLIPALLAREKRDGILALAVVAFPQGEAAGIASVHGWCRVPTDIGEWLAAHFASPVAELILPVESGCKSIVLFRVGNNLATSE
jgi:hypothetical protein